MSWTGIGKKAADFAEVASALGSKVKKTVTKKADQPAAGQVQPDEFTRGGSASSVKQGANLPKDTVTQIQDTEQLLRAPGILEGQVRNMNLDFLKKKEIEILTANGRKADAKALEKMSVADYDTRFKARTDSIVPAEASPKAAAASTQADDADDTAAMAELHRQLGDNAPDITAGLKATQSQIQARFKDVDVAASAAKQEQLNKNTALLEQQIEMARALQEQGKALEANRLIAMDTKAFQAHLVQQEAATARTAPPSLTVGRQAPPRPPRLADLPKKQEGSTSASVSSSQPAKQPPALPARPGANAEGKGSQRALEAPPLPPGKPKMNSKKQFPPPQPPRKQSSSSSLNTGASTGLASPDIAAGVPKLSIAASTATRVPPPLPKKLTVVAAKQNEADLASVNAGSSSKSLFSKQEQAQIDSALKAAKASEAKAAAATRSAKQTMAEQAKVNDRLAKPLFEDPDTVVTDADLAALLNESPKAAPKALTTSASTPKPKTRLDLLSPERQQAFHLGQAQAKSLKTLQEEHGNTLRLRKEGKRVEANELHELSIQRANAVTAAVKAGNVAEAQRLNRLTLSQFKAAQADAELL